MSARPRPRGSIAPFAVWALFGIVAVEVFATYSRLPARELWRVSGTGLEGGASRVLVFLGYPVALVAIAILLLLLDRLPTRRLRLLALLSIGLCTVGFAFVRTSNWDARPVNAIGAAGVVLALLLTIAARRSHGRPTPTGWDRGDWIRLALAAVMLVIAVPVMAADLGFYLDRVPVLGRLYETGAILHEPGVKVAHDAVHHGHHEGMDGVLFVWSALLLWRCLPTVANRRLRGLFGASLCVLLCYGAAEAFGDFWLEQIVKRGWTNWTFDVSYPALTPAWGILLAACAVLWAVTVWPGVRGPRPPSAHAHAGRLGFGSLLVLMLVVGAAWAGTAAAAGRPDIETVVVSRDQAGMLTFVIGFAAPARLDAGTKMEVMLDTDRDSSTGIEGGEYALDYSSPGHGEAPYPSLFTARNGDSVDSSPHSLVFSSTPRSATFRISVYDVGDPDVFDFWVFVEQNGDLLDTAPTHVIISTYAQPWTYPTGGAPSPGQAYPVDTYEDLADGSLETSNLPWLTILLVLIGAGAVLGIGGWTVDRIRKRRRPPPAPVVAAAPPAGTNGHGNGNGNVTASVLAGYSGAPACDLEQQLVQARALAARHETKKALRLADHVRARALVTADVPALEEAWGVAAGVYRESHGRSQQRAGRLAFDCQQNVRSVSRAQALAVGQTWRDPFPPARPAAPPRSGPPSLPLKLLEGHDLARALLLSLLFCAGLALVYALEAGSLRALSVWAAVCGVYWLLFAVLQVRWRRQGREKFWRPVYPTVLLLFLCASLFLLPLLLVPRFRRWLFGNMKPGPARARAV